ncbi:MAG: pseudouridine-5'-phosphate glycosidase [Trueperaceae bacterium]
MTLRIAPNVQHALDAGEPVVALESTVVTHGLPAPRNLELGRLLEAEVRHAGAVPATIGVLGGDLVVGLNDDQLQRLATGRPEKASLWNLAALSVRGAHAGTTVATTVHAAHRAGIAVFATGGIGGVHDHPFDESADLDALARTPVVTVCSGPKSILDAAATLERLESAGVPVVGWRSDHLAGFHLPLTDLPLPARADAPAEIAAMHRAQRAFGLPQAIVVSQPVDDGVDPDAYRGWLEAARHEARARGVHGKDATPFLLSALAERSHGATVDVNMRLLRHNAGLAARIAAALTNDAPAASSHATYRRDAHAPHLHGTDVPG